MTLPPFTLERYFARYEFAAEHLLCCSDCESMSTQELLALESGALQRLMDLRLGYTESTGSPSLRAAISGLYESVSPDHVLVHAGAEEGIFLFMNAALAPGDHLIVHQPCYQSLAEVARSVGCELSAWQAREENGWLLDPDELRRLARPNTRAVVLNTPHNPTGFHMSADAFHETIRFTEARGITLFSDEVYRGLEYTASDRLPAACDRGEKTMSLGVMSKTFGLGGLRIGWIASRDQGLLARVAALKDYTTICSSAPSELLAEVALAHAETIAQRNRQIIASNLVLLEEFFARHAGVLSWVRPRAGPVAFPRLHGLQAEAFCDRLIRTAGLLLLPGSVYSDTGNHLRIGFGRRSMPQALARLEQAMEADGV